MDTECEQSMNVRLWERGEEEESLEACAKSQQNIASRYAGLCYRKARLPQRHLRISKFS